MENNIILPMTRNSFCNMVELLQKNFNSMLQDCHCLFEVALNKEELYRVYLEFYPTVRDPQFHKIRQAQCSYCEQFIRDIGNVVVIKDHEMHTIWGFQCNDTDYQPLLDAMDQYVKSHTISNVFIPKTRKIGTSRNCIPQDNGTVYEWRHLFLEIPKRIFRSLTEYNRNPNIYLLVKKDFQHLFDTITLDSITSVSRLIKSETFPMPQFSSYKANDVFLDKLFLYKKEYDSLSERQKDLYFWEKMPGVSSILDGVYDLKLYSLLKDFSLGMNEETILQKRKFVSLSHNDPDLALLFNQEITGITDMQKKVKRAGGNLDSRFRFSFCRNTIQNEIELVMEAPSALRNIRDVSSSRDSYNIPGVENIILSSPYSIPPGEYRFYAHKKSDYKGGTDGFQAELELNDVVYSFVYDQPLKRKKKIQIAKIRVEDSLFGYQHYEIEFLRPHTIK